MGESAPGFAIRSLQNLLSLLFDSLNRNAVLAESF